MRNAFDLAATEIRNRCGTTRKPAAIEARWYAKLRKENTITATASKKGLVIVNTRVTRLPKNRDLRMKVLKKIVVKLTPDQKEEIVNFILELD